MISWPHAPSKVVSAPGTYMVTAATYHKVKLFGTRERLDYLHDFLLETCLEKGWLLQAWAVFPNHYHFIGFSPEEKEAVKTLTKKLHGKSTVDLNKLDSEPGRVVWYRCWDTRLTYEKSYLARLSYVHWNAVKHGVVKEPENYRWCSARWFAERADKPFYETVMRIPHDQLQIMDDF